MQKQSLSVEILEGLLQLGGMMLYAIPRPLETKYSWAKRLLRADPDSFRHAVVRLENQGYLKIVKKNNQKFLHLTHAGEIESLMRKSAPVFTDKWDGKWRLFMFDIPEESRKKRALIRFWLRLNNFEKLQASVYITPYPLNRETLSYLRQSGLIKFIRILRVDEMDDDKQLRLKYNLKK